MAEIGLLADNTFVAKKKLGGAGRVKRELESAYASPDNWRTEALKKRKKNTKKNEILIDRV